ncbi:TetR/AcrR family transcriptional regulator [Cohnella cholangitidis]|uniref:TetR/AcrR family transcriptional regulator n=1 Tax=Cohnella cholangitidis TaxID=2598458 RepID=UPI0015FAB0FE|nr:TetR/AcrR family transcriptional regulator [Cohnella cholangitidis]
MLREARKQQLKEQIFSEAIRLFKERGYDNVTVEEIVQRCGVAKGTFFNYFPKKEGLLLHLGRSQLETLKQILEKHGGAGDPREKISLIFRQLLSRYREQSDSELLRLVISETIRSALLMKEQTDHITLFQQGLAMLLDEAIASGRLKTRFPAQTIASVLVSLYFNSLMTASVTDHAGVDLYTAIQRELDLVWEGIIDR